MKKSKIIYGFLAMVSLIFLSACSSPFSLGGLKGSGNVITKDVDVSGFEKISLSGKGNLIIEQGNSERLRIEAEDNIMEIIETEVRGNTLYISYKKTSWFASIFRPTKDINFNIKLKDLISLKISGSGTAKMEYLETEDMNINVSGSGKIDMNIEADNLKSKISGSGTFNLSGEVDSQELTISGSGKYFSKKLKSDRAEVNISGSGKVEVNAAKELDISISGSGNLYYIGNPDITQRISGSGKIEQLKGEDGASNDSKVKEATNFQECVSLGNPVMESYPRQCRHGERTFVENIGNENEKQELIHINAPRPNNTIKSPLEISGEARGSWFFEGDFPVVLTDWDGLIIAEGIAKTEGEWMTEDFVSFTASLEFDLPKYKKNGTLILRKDNPSDLPENDDALEVPVNFE
jgi:hypothetical protein